MNISSWDGTISTNDFCLAARALTEKWKVMNPGFPPWTWVPYRRPFCVDSREIEGYLSVKNLYRLGSNKEDDKILSREEESDGFGSEEPVDNATLVQSDDEGVHSYDFHIVYSASYKVPVLYFRGYQCDGQLLALDEIEKDLPLNSLKMLKESKWTFMTQEEHPYLNQPWYTLHPCGTSEWMKLLFHSADSLTKSNETIIQHYLVSWLSVVSQAVGLRIPPEMLNNSSVTVPSAFNKNKNLPKETRNVTLWDPKEPNGVEVLFAKQNKSILVSSDWRQPDY